MRLLNMLSDLKYSVLLVLLINMLFVECLQAQNFKSYSYEGLIDGEISIDSVEFKLNELYKTAELKRDTTNIIKSLISLSAYYRKQQDFSKSFNKTGDALFLSEEFGDPLLIAKSYEEFGVLNYLFKQDNDLGEAFGKSHSLYKELYKSKSISIEQLYRSYYNMVLYYQRIMDLENLKSYIDSCNTITKNKVLKNDSRIFLKEKESFYQRYNGNTKMAISLLKETALELENIKVKNEETANKKSFLIIVYAVLGNVYRSEKDLKTARMYYEKSLNIKDVSGELTFYKAYIYEKYANLLSKMGDDKLAYENLAKAKEINDTYLNTRTDKNRGFIVVNNFYKNQLVKKNNELATNSLMLAEKKQEVLRFRILFFITLSTLIFAGLIIWNRIKHIKYQKKQQNSREVLDHKNKELTANMLKLIERDQIIKKLKEHIEEKDSSKSTKTLLKSIELNSGNLWDEFNYRFTSLNEDFYIRLKEKVTNLSAADLKICALIKLNFTGKEMAYLLGISVGSIHVARHRLRQKMKLDRNVNLTSFINSI
ncbi:helix-turn-helix transcriptional regulator [Lutibacter citreus]|uniref:helix-turn-helix transcriptional regulator n=1 Tax=Lutibacter citreus TaxID=2138210 RepID=UPI0013007E32|nr:hypothetical protein [Lutibacter citreus]